MLSPKLYLHISNLLDTLVEFLAEELSVPLASPFRKEVVVVQSRGMARWVSLELAKRHGIVMNTRFVFPRHFMDEIIRILRPDFSTESDSREVLAWRMATVLPILLKRPEFTDLQYYLDGHDALKEFQLAEKLAELYDQYLVYRPDWIAKWISQGESDDWQAILWQEISKRFPNEQHLADLVDSLDFSNATISTSLPERITIFGISSLPPMFVEIFRKVSFHVPVHLFLLQPTEDYRGDQMSDHRRRRFLARESQKRGRTLALEELNLTRGHPLLESMGEQGKQFLDLIIDAEFHPKRERFQDPGGDTLLHAIQSRMRHNLPDDVLKSKKDFPLSDRSLQLHSCHSPMREVEVLYDRLLDIFEQNSSLEPRDILVMAPEIETYAPLIRAVFNCPENPALRIPFSIADRNPRHENRAVDLFLQLLKLPETRFTSNEIVSILENPLLRVRFDLQDEDLPRIRKWIVKSGIRWGIDATHRETFEVPALAEGTWRLGLDCLLLGYALHSEDGKLFENMLPIDSLEGEEAQAMGRFVMGVEEMIHLVEVLKEPRSLMEWAEALENVVDHFIPNEEKFQREIRSLRRALSSLRKSSRLSKHVTPVELRVIRHHFEKILQLDVHGGGFLTGGVTFCSLKPMRSIPSRVICLLGMNDGDFPRRPVRVGFDRMATEPRLGDRSVREDDRYLFLETIFSAEDLLLISHVGQSMRDQTARPPSVVVSELFDHADRIASMEGKKPSEQLLIKHPLHPFSIRSFSGEEHFSYSEVNAAAARQIRHSRRGGSAPTMPRVSSKSSFEERSVELAHMLDFFSKPTSTFLKDRFRVRLGRGGDRVESEEDFSLDSLEEYHFMTNWVQRLLQGTGVPDWEEVRARGNLPLGRMGEAGYCAVRQEAEHFHERLKSLFKGTIAQSVEIDLPVEGGRLHGRVDGVYPRGLLQYHVSKWKARHAIRAWLNHLALQAATGCAGETLFVTKTGIQIFIVPSDPLKALDRLIEIYRLGMSRPLPIFPEASYEYAHYTLCRTTRMRRSGLEVARQAWEGSHSTGRGDRDELACRLLFSDRDPLDAEFENLSIDIFGDMLLSQRRKMEEEDL